MGVILIAALAWAPLPGVSRVLIGAAFLAPIPTGAVLMGLIAHGSFAAAKSRPVAPHIGVIVDLVGELRAGASLRAVLADGSLGSSVAAVARSGRPLSELDPRSFDEFGDDGGLIAATVAMAVEGGGPVAEGFEALAVGMMEAEATRRDRRAAMAPAVAQAVIVGGAPLLLLMHMIASGRLLTLLAAGPSSAALVGGGVLLVTGGITCVVVMVARGHR